jgi:hypothetical protein
MASVGRLDINRRPPTKVASNSKVVNCQLGRVVNERAFPDLFLKIELGHSLIQPRPTAAFTVSEFW